jgi:hypothetical protein
VASSLQAAAIAPAARAWLAATTAARVLNVFDRALNLVNERGDVLSIVTHERGMTPFGLALEPDAPFPFTALAANSAVTLGPTAISIDALRVTYAAAAPWNPRPDWEAVRDVLVSQPQRIADLAAVALPVKSVFIPPDGLGAETGPAGPNPAAPPPASLLDLFAGHAASALPEPLYRRAHQAATTLVSGLHANDEPQALSAVRRLAGLGGGLTPAGDDFVVGVCLAAWAGLYPPPARDIGVLIARVMSPLTTHLSAAYLRASAQGECSAHWHSLFAALLVTEAGPRQAALTLSVAGLFALGHTSGADGLAGFLAYNRL